MSQPGLLGKSLPTANCCSQRPDLNIDKGLCLDFCVRTELAGVTTLGHKQRRKKKKKEGEAFLVLTLQPFQEVLKTQLPFQPKSNGGSAEV